MSSITPALPAPPPPRLLTPEASNVMGWWWLAIVTAIVLLCSMWPSIFADSGGGLSATSSYLLVILCSGLLGLGVWCSYGFAKAQPWSARMMRLITMIGLGVGLVGVAYFLYSVAFAAATPGGQSFWGPSGVLSGIMWGMIIILPFIFGLTLIFGLMNDAVDEWFNPPPVTDDRTMGRLQINPRTAALMVRSSGTDGDEALMGELSEAMSLTGKSTTYDDHSVEVIGSSEDDLSVEVIGGKQVKRGSSDSMEELAALEEALTHDASKKGKKDKKKKEEKLDIGKGDEPLKVDDDFKL